MERCTVAVGQICSTNDKTTNIQRVDELVSQAVSQHHAEIVFFPEATDYISNSEKETIFLAENLNGTLVKTFKNIARSKKVWLGVGFHERTNEADEINIKVYNSYLIINNEGEIVSLYRKIHLFDLVLPDQNIDCQESKTVSAGANIVEPVPTPAGNLGTLICYDLRFPELSITLRQMGATVLIYPSAFTHRTGEAHWLPLLRARAIENQCFVIAPAQCGMHNENRISYGHSMIIDPWGKIMAECPKFTTDYFEEGTLTSTVLEQKYLNEVRNKMPVFSHRRSDIYSICISAPVDQFQECDLMFADKIIPAGTIFYRTKLSFAFTNIRCVVPGHVLISSRRIVPKISQLTNEEIADLFQTTVKVQKVMERLHDVNCSTLVVQDGIDAGQTIPHVHCHILPRRPGDFDNNDDIYTNLASHDKEDSMHAIRDIKEMIREAQIIKKLIYAVN